MTETLTRWHPAASADDFVEQASLRVLTQAEAAIAAHGQFHVVLAGGQTPQPLYARLRSADTDWSAWHVYFGDERCLPPDHPERNSIMAMQSLLAHVPIPDHQVHPIDGEQGAYDAARAYSRVLRGLGHVDMVLLGLGEDGHTASLFPGHYWGIERDSRAVLAVFNAPKAPPERVTLSANRLSRASSVLFLVDGESKREAVSNWREGKSMPAAAIKPTSGVDVLVAAGLLGSGLES